MHNKALVSVCTYEKETISLSSFDIQNSLWSVTVALLGSGTFFPSACISAPVNHLLPGAPYHSPVSTNHNSISCSIRALALTFQGEAFGNIAMSLSRLSNPHVELILSGLGLPGN